jgi:hypothetical protein
VYRSRQFGHANTCSLETQVRTFSSLRSNIICRVQSVEGTEKAYGSDTNQEQKQGQKNVEFYKEGLEGAGQTSEECPQETAQLESFTSNPEKVDYLASGEKEDGDFDTLLHSLIPGNNGILISSYDEVDQMSGDEGPEEMVPSEEPSEELHDYGSGTDWEDQLESYVTRISVPRQRYIPVPKVELVDSLLGIFFQDKDASEYLSICT